MTLVAPSATTRPIGDDALLRIHRREPQYQLCGGGYGVLYQLAHGGVPALAVNGDMQLVVRGHVFAGPEAECTHLKLRLDVLADDSCDVVSFERFLGENERCPARDKLLARLEEPEYCTVEIPVRLQPLQHAEEYGGMHGHARRRA